MTEENKIATNTVVCPHLDSRQELLRQGAEARLYRTFYRGRPCIAKERFEKKYRIKELDERLRKKQLNAEIKALERARSKNILVPQMYGADKEHCIIFMEELKGQTVRDYVNSLGDLKTPRNQLLLENLGVIMGKAISDLHTQRIMHGDLTTSNMLLPDDAMKMTVPAAATAAAEKELVKHVLDSTEKASTMAAENARLLSNGSNVVVASGKADEDDVKEETVESQDSKEMQTLESIRLEPMLMPTKVALLDLGLSFQSDMVEDRAVDMYVMERAIQTTHLNSEMLIHVIFNTYKNCNVNGNKVMTRLNDVRSRGRKRSMVG